MAADCMENPSQDAAGCVDSSRTGWKLHDSCSFLLKTHSSDRDLLHVRHVEHLYKVKKLLNAHSFDENV